MIYQPCYEWVIAVLRQSGKFTAISWREQVSHRNDDDDDDDDDDDVHFMLDQHA